MQKSSNVVIGNGSESPAPLTNQDLRPEMFASKGDTVFLGGIYVQDTVQAWLNVVGPSGKIIVVEANPDSVSTLLSHFDGQNNLTIVNKALWNSQGELLFTRSRKKYQGWARVAAEGIDEYPDHLDPDHENIKVPADTIDHILQEMGVDKIDLIFLTINDAQLYAVEGLEDVISRNESLHIFINTRTPDPCWDTAKKLDTYTSLRVCVVPLVKKIKRDDVKKLSLIHAWNDASLIF